VLLGLSKPIKGTICYFSAFGFYRLFRIPVNLFNDEIGPPEELLGKHYRPLKDKLANTVSPADKKRVLDTFFESLMKQKPRVKSLIAGYAQDLIIRYAGAVPVDRLLQQFYVSRRTLERYFRDQVGLSPKQFSKVIRFNRAFALLNSDPSISWADLIHRCNYFDQSHFIAEFKSFMECTPTEYLRRKASVSSYYVGRATETDGA